MRFFLTFLLLLIGFDVFAQVSNSYKGNFIGNARSAAINLQTLDQSGATTGQAPVWNGTAWVPGTVGGGSATNAIANTNGVGTNTTLLNPTITNGTIQTATAGVLTITNINVISNGIFGVSVSTVNLLASGTNNVTGNFNVKSYGAVGNDVVDDTASIMAAITAAGGFNGGTNGRDVYIPGGYYKVSSTFNIPYPITLHGDGSSYYELSGNDTGLNPRLGATIIDWSSITAANLFVLTNGSRVHDIAFIGSSNATLGAAIIIPWNGISGAVSAGQIANKVDIWNCSFHFGWIGIDNQVGAYWSHYNNLFVSQVWDGERVNNCVAADWGDWSIAGSTYTQNNFKANAAIEVIGGGGGQIGGWKNKVNNLVSTYGWTNGILVAPTNAFTSQLLIQNNDIEFCLGAAIRTTNVTGVNPANRFDNIQIQDNYLDCNTASTNMLIVLDGFVGMDAIITGNTFNNIFGLQPCIWQSPSNACTIGMNYNERGDLSLTTNLVQGGTINPLQLAGTLLLDNIGSSSFNRRSGTNTTFDEAWSFGDGKNQHYVTSFDWLVSANNMTLRGSNGSINMIGITSSSDFVEFFNNLNVDNILNLHSNINMGGNINMPFGGLFWQTNAGQTNVSLYVAGNGGPFVQDYTFNTNEFYTQNTPHPSIGDLANIWNTIYASNLFAQVGMTLNYGTINTVLYLDASKNVQSATVGTGLSLSGGALTATGGGSGPVLANNLPATMVSSIIYTNVYTNTLAAATTDFFISGLTAAYSAGSTKLSYVSGNAVYICTNHPTCANDWRMKLRCFLGWQTSIGMGLYTGYDINGTQMANYNVSWNLDPTAYPTNLFTWWNFTANSLTSWSLDTFNYRRTAYGSLAFTNAWLDINYQSLYGAMSVSISNETTTQVLRANLGQTTASVVAPSTGGSGYPFIWVPGGAGAVATVQNFGFDLSRPTNNIFLVVGDSIACGVSSGPSRGGWPQYAASELGGECVVYGKGGDTTPMLILVTNEIAALQPTLILNAIGGNDTSLTVYSDPLLAIEKLITKTNVIDIGPTPRFGIYPTPMYLWNWDTTNGTEYVELLNSFDTNGAIFPTMLPLYQGDPPHPNDLAHRIIGTTVASYLRLRGIQ